MNTENLIQLLVSSLEVPVSSDDQRLMKLLGSAMLAMGGVLMQVANAEVNAKAPVEPPNVEPPNVEPPSVEPPSVEPPTVISAPNPPDDAAYETPVDFIKVANTNVAMTSTAFESNVEVFERFQANLSAIDLDDPAQVRAWLRKAKKGFKNFQPLPGDTKRRYLELLVAIGRHLSNGGFMKEHSLDFHKLKESHVDGFVYGLAANHEPQHGQWVRDARAILQELQPPAPQTKQPSASKKKMVTNKSQKPVKVCDQVLGFTRGKTLAIVGGTEIAVARQNLIQAMDLKELRWVTTKKKNQVASALTKLKNDKIDLAVVTLRFTSHGAQEQMRAVDNRRVIFTKGYGISEIEQAIIEWMEKAE